MSPRAAILFVLAVAAAAAAVLLGMAGYHRYQERYTVTARDDGRAVAQVLGATLKGASALKVSTLSGTVQSVANDSRALGWLNSDRVVKAPVTVDYVVDLSRLSPRDLRWDGAARVLVVNVPEVTVEKPNVDEGAATLVRTRGVFVTRAAADALARATSQRAEQTAAAEARRPEHLLQARRYARREIAALFAAPLTAAGLPPAHVQVVFPTERGARSERWDTSRSLAQIFADTK